MSEYHKIQTLWLRDPATGHKTLLPGQWALPEFGFLKDLQWRWTEKIDGTNVRVFWDGERVRFGGKTDNAQLPAPLVEHLMDALPPVRLREALKGPLTLYGEGYGPKIQNGGNYGDTGFVLFDAAATQVNGEQVWLERETVEVIAQALHIPVAPEIGQGTLLEAIRDTERGFGSLFAERSRPAEGMVVRPLIELKDRRGHRIIGKIKRKDFGP